MLGVAPDDPEDAFGNTALLKAGIGPMPNLVFCGAKNAKSIVRPPDN